MDRPASKARQKVHRTVVVGPVCPSRLLAKHQSEKISRGVFSCTNTGALKLHPHSDSATSTSVLPTRLCAWRLDSGQKTFAYGGDEVDVSVWDTERAFQSPVPDSKKRKRTDLFPAEVWRAKNVSFDCYLTDIYCS